MCKGKSCCEDPEKKVKDPKKCSPEQIAECHPESKRASVYGVVDRSLCKVFS